MQASGHSFIPLLVLAKQISIILECARNLARKALQAKYSGIIQLLEDLSPNRDRSRTIKLGKVIDPGKIFCGAFPEIAAAPPKLKFSVFKARQR